MKTRGIESREGCTGQRNLTLQIEANGEYYISRCIGRIDDQCEHSGSWVEKTTSPVVVREKLESARSRVSRAILQYCTRAAASSTENNDLSTTLFTTSSSTTSYIAIDDGRMKRLCQLSRL